MFRMSASALRSTLRQLQQATRDHRGWREHIARIVFCGLPCPPDERMADAHQRCALGRWYYSAGSAGLRNEGILAALETQHELVHRVAAEMLRKYAAGQPIPPAEYDSYVSANEKLRRELDALRHDIQDILRSSDPLTGAFGRALLLPDLRQWHALAAREVQFCCLAFMDVDQLKEVNDIHGHTVGDQVLAGMVGHVSQHLRPYDRIYRYGGDEFVLSLPASDLKQAENLIERLRAEIAELPLVMPPEGAPIHATASFGLAMLDPEISVEESVDRADRALLLAKTSGRNRVVCWDPGVTTGTILAWQNRAAAGEE